MILVTESAAELHADLLQNPHVAQVRIDLPDAEETHHAFCNRLGREFDWRTAIVRVERLRRAGAGARARPV